MKIMSDASNIALAKPQEKNKYDQTHYGSYADAKKALDDGKLTFGSTITASDGTIRVVDGLAYGSSGTAYITSCNEAMFDDIVLPGNEKDLGCKLQPGDYLKGEYYLVPPNTKLK